MSYTFKSPSNIVSFKPLMREIKHTKENIEWLNQGLHCSIIGNDLDGVNKYLSLGAKPLSSAHEIEKSPLMLALREAELPIIQAIWDKAKSTNIIYFDGHYGPETLSYDSKRCFDEESKKVNDLSFHWRRLDRFLPEALTICCVKHHRLDVLIWALENGANPHPKVFTNHDNRQSTHHSLRLYIFHKAIEILRDELFYSKPRRADFIAQALEYVAAQLPLAENKNVIHELSTGIISIHETQVQPLCHFSLSKVIQAVWNEHTPIDNDEPMTLSFTDITRRELSERGADVLFKSLNNFNPRWLGQMNLNSDWGETQAHALFEAAVKAPIDADYNVRQLTAKEHCDFIFTIMSTAIQGINGSDLEAIFYRKNIHDATFFDWAKEFRPLNIQPAVQSFESLVQNTILTSKNKLDKTKTTPRHAL